MDVTIECANRADAPVLLALQRLAFQSEAALYDDYTIAPLTQTLAELEAEFADHVILKALVDGRIVGSVRARCMDTACYVGRLIVHPDHQGLGIGRRLMAAIEGRFPEAARFELFTGHRSERNLRLYRGLGYCEKGTREVGEGLVLAFFVKEQAVIKEGGS